jgi:hypothetical protein
MWERFDRDLARISDEAMKRAAKLENERQAEAVSRGQAADGTRQKSNQPETTRRKGGKASLVNTGLLADAGAYRIVRNSTRGVQAWTSLPPSARESILGHLAAQGYAVWRVPSTVVQDDAGEIRKGLRNLRPSYRGR